MLLNYADMPSPSATPATITSMVREFAVTVYRTAGMIEVGILPQRLRVYVDADARDTKPGGLMDTSRTSPAVRPDEVNGFPASRTGEHRATSVPRMHGWVPASAPAHRSCHRCPTR